MKDEDEDEEEEEELVVEEEEVEEEGRSHAPPSPHRASRIHIWPSSS